MSLNRSIALGLSHKGLEAAVIAELEPLPNQAVRSAPICDAALDSKSVVEEKALFKPHPLLPFSMADFQHLDGVSEQAQNRGEPETAMARFLWLDVAEVGPPSRPTLAAHPSSLAPQNISVVPASLDEEVERLGAQVAAALQRNNVSRSHPSLRLFLTPYLRPSETLGRLRPGRPVLAGQGPAGQRHPVPAPRAALVATGVSRCGAGQLGRGAVPGGCALQDSQNLASSFSHRLLPLF